MSAYQPRQRRAHAELSEAAEELLVQVVDARSTARHAAEIAQQAVGRAMETQEAARRLRAWSTELRSRIEFARANRAVKRARLGQVTYPRLISGTTKAQVREFRL